MEKTMKSRIYKELREKYMTRKLTPYILIGLVFWVAYMTQLIWAMSQLPTVFKYI